mmetsp:Transcript_6942/g.17221  ORF Transcript_6942/g.17221 Transcript_6942/m.17221 type:complete len:393 (+) Transcript_6942:100-1278(+)
MEAFPNTFNQSSSSGVCTFHMTMKNEQDIMTKFDPDGSYSLNKRREHCRSYQRKHFSVFLLSLLLASSIFFGNLSTGGMHDMAISSLTFAVFSQMERINERDHDETIFESCKPYGSYVKNETISLQDAFTSNHTTVYFLHQRKAAGSSLRRILFNKLKDAVGKEEAFARSYMPCITTSCQEFELPIYEANYLGELKLVGGHMSYHVPFARAIYDEEGIEQSVFITNFRDPLSRIKSCMFYRYPSKTFAVLRSKDFSVKTMENLLMTRKDQFNSTCIQEPFRILSPFSPDKEPVSQNHINQICCFVKRYFHVVSQYHHTNKMTSTVIEKELLDSLNKTVLKRQKSKMNSLEETRWMEFMDYLLKTNPFIHSELSLYSCILDDAYDPNKVGNSE